MKKTLLAFAIVLTLVACSKNQEQTQPPPPPDPDPDPGPLLIEKRIYRYMNNGQLVSDTTSFEYDEAGRVTGKKNSSGLEEEYTYSGDKISSIKSKGVTGFTESLNFAYYSTDGDTIMLDFTRPDPTAEGMDTVQLTYIYNDDLVTDFWTYLHFYDGFVHFQKQTFEYNTDGNLTAMYLETLVNPRQLWYQVTGWDHKTNPKSAQPKLNYMLLDSGLPLESSSANNPVAYIDGSNTETKFELTYNDEGFPLTVRSLNEDFVRTQIIYNR